VLKLVSKSRHGAKLHKVYDIARTPYQRLAGSGMLTEEKKRQLARIYTALNPVTLLNQIKEEVASLDPGCTCSEKLTIEFITVTVIMTQQEVLR
jgi:hypothetical protein